ncbi:MAG: DinB family protein [Propionibacteriaceae bacterium]
MTESTSETTTNTAGGAERDELIAMVQKQRGLFLVTAQGLTDEQARLTPTVSTLSLGGLVKHVTTTEAGWLDFIEHGAPDQQVDWEHQNEAAYQAYADGFRLLADETLAGVLDAYAVVAARAVELVQTVDLDLAHALPEAPWFAKESWSNRRVLIHLIAETAQHAGHADIIRETIDGQRTMA